MNPNLQTPEQVRIAGFQALHHALGLVGMIRFLQQYETGSGDYSKDRHAWLEWWALDDIRRELEAQFPSGDGADRAEGAGAPA